MREAMPRRRYRLAVRNRPDAIALIVVALFLGGTFVALGLALLACFALAAAALAGGSTVYERLRARAHLRRRARYTRGEALSPQAKPRSLPRDTGEGSESRR
jgi:hypothetical protein